MTRVYYHLSLPVKKRLEELVEDYIEVATAIETIMEIKK